MKSLIAKASFLFDGTTVSISSWNYKALRSIYKTVIAKFMRSTPSSSSSKPIPVPSSSLHCEYLTLLTKNSSQITKTQSPNKHNRLYLTAQLVPLHLLSVDPLASSSSSSSCNQSAPLAAVFELAECYRTVKSISNIDDSKVMANIEQLMPDVTLEQVREVLGVLGLRGSSDEPLVNALKRVW
jgi:hypothetical protein